MRKLFLPALLLCISLLKSFGQSSLRYTTPSFVNPKSQSTADSLLGKWRVDVMQSKRGHFFNSKLRSVNETYSKGLNLKSTITQNPLSLLRLNVPPQLQRVNSYQSKYTTNLKSFQNPHAIIEQGRSVIAKNEKVEDLQSRYGKAQKTLAAYMSMKFDSSVVYNHKALKKYYDSINKVIAKVPYNEMLRQPLSKEQLVKQVNAKFKKDATTFRDSLTTVYNDSIKSTTEKKINLSQLTLSEKSLDGLQPMGLTTMKTKYLNKLDSIRKVQMKIEKIKMKEVENNLSTKMAYVKNKETIWQKTYFEGVIGLLPAANSGFQFSPALAYHLSPLISLGVGPNLMIKTDAQKVVSTFGYRTFSKAEFLNRHLYLQAEDMINPATLRSDGLRFTHHNFYAGAGVVIPFLKPLSLNFSLLYKAYSNEQSTTNNSLWIFRVGFSQIKNHN